MAGAEVGVDSEETVGMVSPEASEGLEFVGFDNLGKAREVARERGYLAPAVEEGAAGLVAWVKVTKEDFAEQVAWVRFVSDDGTRSRSLSIPNIWEEVAGDMKWVSRVRKDGVFGLPLRRGLPPEFEISRLEFWSGEENGRKVLGTISLEGVPVASENMALTTLPLVQEAALPSGEKVVASRVSYPTEGVFETWADGILNVGVKLEGINPERIYSISSEIVESTWQEETEPRFTSAFNSPDNRAHVTSLFDSQHDQADKVRIAVRVRSFPKADRITYEVSGVKPVYDGPSHQPVSLDFSQATFRQTKGRKGRLSLGLPVPAVVSNPRSPFRFQVFGAQSEEEAAAFHQTFMVSDPGRKLPWQSGTSALGFSINFLDKVGEVTMILENSSAFDQEGTVELVIPTRGSDIVPFKQFSPP